MNELFANCASLDERVVSYRAALAICALRGVDPFGRAMTPAGELIQWQAIIFEATLMGNCTMIVLV